MSWINVKDRLPDKDCEVIICEDGFVRPAGFKNSTKEFVRLNRAIWINSDRTKMVPEFDWQDDITHWMPLPEPPTE